MPFVIDASAAAAWALADEEDPQADAALDRLRRDSAFVPALFFYEIRNILVVCERRGRISAVAKGEFLRMLARLPISVDSGPDETELLRLARAHASTVYDAAYLELALRRRLDLVTLDTKLEAAKRAEGAARRPA